MSQNPSPDHQMLQNLAHVLYEQRKQELKQPAVTDQHILRAMLGKPWNPEAAEPAQTRKAG